MSASRKQKIIPELEFLRNDWFIEWLREDIKTRDFKKQTEAKFRKHVPGKSKRVHLTKDDKERIKQLYSNGSTKDEIAEMFHITRTTVSHHLKCNKDKKGTHE